MAVAPQIQASFDFMGRPIADEFHGFLSAAVAQVPSENGRAAAKAATLLAQGQQARDAGNYVGASKLYGKALKAIASSLTLVP